MARPSGSRNEFSWRQPDVDFPSVLSDPATFSETQTQLVCRSRAAQSCTSSQFSVTNTDDFIWRLVKGCIQIGFVPDIGNAVNTVPADRVATVTALAGILPLQPSTDPVVLHLEGSPRITFNFLLSSLARYGYAIQQCEYLVWRAALERGAVADNALFPLLHFVLDDLPTSTRAPALDDSNTVALLQQSGEKITSAGGITLELLGLYLSWLVRAGFLPPPTGVLPLPLLGGQAVRAVGRSGL